MIREETSSDIKAIHQVEARAFGRAAEADLVDTLRANGKVSLSLVAVEGGVVVGHVLFSPGKIETPGGALPVQGLGPLAVDPDWQRRGIGAALVRAGLERLRAAGHRLAMVEGDPKYYTRFGFENATPRGIHCEFNPPPGCFMVQALAPGALDGVQGMAHYAAEFRTVE